MEKRIEKLEEMVKELRAEKIEREFSKKKVFYNRHNTLQEALYLNYEIRKNGTNELLFSFKSLSSAIDKFIDLEFKDE